MAKRLIILQDELVNPIVEKQAYHMTCIASAWLHDQENSDAAMEGTGWRL